MDANETCMNMKKVLFLIPTLGHGGAERVLVNLVNNMDRTKFSITVQTLFDEGINKQYLKNDIIYKSFMKHQFHGNSWLLACVPAKLLYRIVVREDYDYVVSYLEGPTAHLVSGCPNKKSKTVGWIHTELNQKSVLWGFITRKAAIRGYRKIEQFVCVSQTVQQAFENVTGIKHNRIRTLYNTNETNEIIQKAKNSINDIQFKNDEINIISVGKLQRVKGYDRLVNVHKKLIDEGINVHTYILGIGEEKQKIEDIIDELNSQDTVSLLGYRDNPYKYVANADLYVCSSRREGFSTAVTEALIVGTPVVSTQVSGAYELLGNNEYGIVVDNTEDGLYRGIKQLVIDTQQRQYYKEKAKERGQAFSTENTVKAVEEMLLSL